MIHLDTASGGQWLTEEQLEAKYPGLYEELHRDRTEENINAGRRLKYLRVKANLTVREMAKLLCIGLAECSAIETGKICPTVDQVAVYQMLKFKNTEAVPK
jgi:hypothetical protein